MELREAVLELRENILELQEVFVETLIFRVFSMKNEGFGGSQGVQIKDLGVQKGYRSRFGGSQGEVFGAQLLRC